MIRKRLVVVIGFSSVNFNADREYRSALADIRDTLLALDHRENHGLSPDHLQLRHDPCIRHERQLLMRCKVLQLE